MRNISTNHVSQQSVVIMIGLGTLTAVNQISDTTEISNVIVGLTT